MRSQEALLTGRIGGSREAHRVSSVEELRARARELRARRGQVGPLVPRPERPIAFVNLGRWLILCDCGNAPSADPTWGVAVCFTCGSEYRPAFPADRAAVEVELLARPDRRARNFMPDERIARRHAAVGADDLARLRRENAERGIGRARGGGAR